MKKTKKQNRWLALALCLCMLVNVIPLSGMIYAAETGCNHEHDTVVCGYIKAVEGQPCTFTHEHDGACGWAEAKDAVPCAVEAAHVHDAAVCGYVETVTGAPCSHEHDADCGGLQAEPTACALTEGCKLPAGHEGACELPTMLGDPVKDSTYVGNGFTFTWATGHLAVTTNEGTSNWLGDTQLGESYKDPYAAIRSVELGENVTAIASETFGGCENLTAFSVASGSIAFEAADGVLYTKGKAALVYYPQAKAGNSFTVPGTVKTIGEEAFSGCTNLQSVNLPEGLETIGGAAFTGCTGLTGMTLPGTLTDIGDWAFGHCTGLTSVTFPEGLQNIWDAAFFSCANLKDLTFLGNAPPAIKEGAFSGVPASGAIHYPAGAGANYTENWRNGTTGLSGWTLTEQSDPADNPTVVASGNCGWNGADNMKWSLGTDGVLTISGSGSMGSYYMGDSQPPWSNYSAQITSVIIQAGVEDIGSYAFGNCSSLTSVTFSDSLQAIGYSAFSKCTGLTSVTFPAGLQNISDDAFFSCTNLKALTFLGNAPPAIKEGAFSGVFATGAIHYPAGAGANYTENWRNGTTGLSGWTLTEQSDPADNPTVVASGNCGRNGADNMQWSLGTDGVLTISGSGTMGSYYYMGDTQPPWIKYSAQITSIIIEAGVANIGDNAFYKCTSLTSVTFPESLQSIGQSAFYGCTSLTSVTFPKSLQSIGQSAFYGCIGLTSVTLPEGLQNIRDLAFYNCTGLTAFLVDPDNQHFVSEEGVLYDVDKKTLLLYPLGKKESSFTIPGTVHTIGTSAFSRCGLQSVSFPKGLQTIGNEAFSYCTGLTSVTFPEGLQNIWELAFGNCTNLNALTFLGNSPPTIGSNAFYGVSASGTIHYPAGAGASYTEDWKTNTAKLSGWTLTEQSDPADNPTVVASGNCGENGDNMQWSLGTDGVLTISGSGKMGNYFYEATKRPPWHNHLEQITSVIIQAGVESVGDYAFNNCTNLTSVTFPDSLQTIGESAFYRCISLTSVTLPKGLQAIASFVFNNCTSLTAFLVDPDNQHFSSEEGVLYDVAKETLLLYPYGKKTSSFTIPGTVHTIGPAAFTNCTKLTSVTFPASLQTIGEDAFSNCTGLTSLTFPDGLQAIGKYAFDHCTNLTSLTFPMELHTIGNYAFYSCTKLKGLTFLGETPPEINPNAFSDVFATGDIYYPAGAGANYTENWKTNTAKLSGWTLTEQSDPADNPTVVASGNCGPYGADNMQWSLGTDGVLTISGSGTMNNYYVITPNEPPWSDYRGQITSVIIEADVAKIGSNAFYNCTNLTSVTFPDSLQDIANYAFDNCTGLTSVTFPAGLQNIWNYAFYRCTGLTTLTFLGNTPPAIKEGVFPHVPASGIIHYPAGAGANYTEDWKNNTAKLPGWTLRGQGAAFVPVTDITMTNAASVEIKTDLPLAATVAPDAATHQDIEWSVKEAGKTGATINGAIFRAAAAGTATILATVKNGLAEGGDPGSDYSKEFSITVLDSDTTLTVKFDDNKQGGASLDDNEMKEAVDAALSSRGKGEADFTAIRLEGEAKEITSWNWKYLLNLYQKNSKWTKLTIMDLSGMGGLTKVENEKKGSFAADFRLTTVQFPASLQTIGDAVFYSCKGLTSVTFPASLQSIGDYAFYRCTGLTSFSVDPENQHFTGKDGVLYDKSMKTLLQYPSAKSEDSFAIPDTVQTIGYYAFYRCAGLQSVTFPDTLQTIGDRAFYYCTGLTSVSFPNGLQTIGNYAFSFCGSLTSMTFLGEKPPAIGMEGFPNVPASGIIHYPAGAGANYTEDWKNNTAKLPGWTLRGQGAAFVPVTDITMTNAASVEINTDLPLAATVAPDAATHQDIEWSVKEAGKTGATINGAIFRAAAAGTATILATVKNSLAEGGDYSKEFFITVLDPSTTLTVKFDDNKQGGASLDDNEMKEAVEEALRLSGKSEADFTAVRLEGEAKEITSWNWKYLLDLYWIHGGWTKLTIMDLSGMGGLTKVENVEKGSFAVEFRLTTVQFPASLQTIGDRAFYYCDSLQNASFPESLQTIGYRAFYYCKGLTSVSFPEPLQTIGDDAFYNCTGLTSFSVDPENQHFIGKDGVLYDKSMKTLLQYPQAKRGDSFAIPGTVKTIGYNAFFHCADLQSVSFPNGLQAIGKEAFIECIGLQSASFPDTLQTIGKKAFIGCTGLTSVTFPASLQTIESMAFGFCSSLTSMTFLGETPPNVNRYAFGEKADGPIAVNGTLYHPAKAAAAYARGAFGPPPLDGWTRVPNSVESGGTVCFAGNEWYVIGLNGQGVHAENGTITLLSKANLFTTKFHDSSNEYGGSTLHEKMKEYYNGLSAADRAVILPRTLDGVRVGSDLNATLPGDHYVWPLSYDEAISLPRDILRNGAWWWIRSTYTDAAEAGAGDPYGGVGGCELLDDIGGRPALTLDLNAVIFASVSAGEGGSITPSGTVSAPKGGDMTFTLKADDGYHIEQLLVDGQPVTLTGGSYTLTEAANCTVEARFAKDTGGGDNPPPHSHSHSYGGWQHDDTHHWHACSCGDLADKAVHDFGGWVTDKKPTSTDAGSRHRDCNTCGYRQTGSIAPTGPDFEYRTLTDETSGVQVSGLFTASAALAVQEVSLHAEGDCAVCDDLRQRQKNGELIVLFDIALKSGKYTGELEVEIPVGEQYNGQTVIMLHCKDKVLESRTVTVSGGVARGAFSSLSPYAVAKVPDKKVPGKTAITGLPESYTLLVGQSVSWTPAPAGGEWSCDKDLLEMTKDGDTYTFKALKEGEAAATYTVDGVPHTITITVNSSTMVETGNTTNTMPWTLPLLLLLLAGLIGCGLLVLVKRRGESKKS